MRRAVDDVRPTLRARCFAAQLSVLVIVMADAALRITAASLPLDLSAAVPASGGNDPSDGSERLAFDEKQNLVVELRVLYVCDHTSVEFCRLINTSQPLDSDGNRSHQSDSDNRYPQKERTGFYHHSHHRTDTVSSLQSILPRGCVDTNSSNSENNNSSNTNNINSKSSFNTNFRDESSTLNFQNRSTDTTSGDSTGGRPSYRCWHLQGGGVLLEKSLPSNSTLRAHVGHVVVQGVFINRLKALDLQVGLSNADVLVAVGNALTVQTAAITGEGRALPVLGYITEYPHGRKPIQGRTFVSLNPDPEAQGLALAQVIGEFNMKQTAVIIEQTRLADGFLRGVRQAVNARRQDVFHIQPLPLTVTTERLLEILVSLSNTGWNVILVHTSPSLMLKVVTCALSTRLYNTGYAWFLSEAALSRETGVLQQLPDGLLAIDSFWLGGLSDVISTSLERILESITCLLLSQSNTVPYPKRNFSDVAEHMTTNKAADATEDNPNSTSSKQTVEAEVGGNLSYLKLSSASIQGNISSSSSSSPNATVAAIAALRSSSTDFVSCFLRCLRQFLPQTRGGSSNNGGNLHSAKHPEGFTPETHGALNTNGVIEQMDIPDKRYKNGTLSAARAHSSSKQQPESQLLRDKNNANAASQDDTKIVWTQSDEWRDVPGRFRREQSYTGPAFSLVNTIRGWNGTLLWSKVGYITASGDRDLRTVLWPGHNIYGPSSSMVKTYRVVTRAAEPFIFFTSQVMAKEECMSNVPCLQLKNSSKVLVERAVEDFETSMRLVGKLYTLHCCKGLSLDMLDRLSVDLNFRYVLYFVNDTNYGSLENGVWTGMVGDILSDVADVVIGAFSITAERMKIMDFTEPFYQNEFALITGEDGIYVSIWAFMSPFSGQVWLCIMLSSIVAGIATSILEWHSPFGLNPKGRKRTKNYGLGSGLLMVMVLLTGHTINVKAPKSWPGKVIQNVWAGLAIFIMTSYTANLAAYLAGQSVVTTVSSVFDPELLTKKVAVVPTSAVEYFVEKIHPRLAARAKIHSVSSTEEAITLLKAQKVDVYMDDMPLLEFALARYDETCKVRFAGKGFGSDGYALGLPRYSWLKIPISNQIRKYTETGYIQELAAKYLSRPRCESFLVGTAKPYGLEPTGGLFIILLSAVVLSVIFLLLEHLAYHYLVPWLRRQPIESFWKRESFAFISQRVFRVVRSERLYSQKQAAQEMIKIVKQRDFTRLIQKNELQKRRLPTQKRVKTKAEVFQEITANIVSYHRQLQSASEDLENMDASDLDEEYLQGYPNGPASDHRARDATLGDFTTDAGFHNVAYSGGSSCSTVVSRRRHGYRANMALSIDDDDNVVFLDDRLLEEDEEDELAGAKRKGSSRSFVLHSKTSPQGRPYSAPRKLSDSNCLYLPWDRQQPSPYIVPHSSRFNPPVSLQQFLPFSPPPHTNLAATSDNGCDNINPIHGSSQTNLSRPYTSRVVKEEDNARLPYPLPESGKISNAALNTDAEYPGHPLDSAGRSYYYSPTSSSVQTLSEERREFSPLSSPNTPNTDDELSGCMETSFTSNLSPLSPGQTAPLGFPTSTAHRPPEQGHSFPADQGDATSKNLVASEVRLDPVRLASTEDLPHLSPQQQQQIQTQQTLTSQPATSPPSCDSDAYSLSAVEGRPDNAKCLKDSVHTAGDPKSGTSHISSADGNPVIEVPQRTVGVKRNRSAVFTIEEEGRALKGKPSLRAYRRASLDSEHVNNAWRGQGQGDYFRRNLRLKDNRVKSTLRRHAMSGYQSQLPADYIDECTLEALSKEDVLLLWRKSELDLESRLHEVLTRNRRLSLAIDYLTGQDAGEPAGNV